MTTIYRILRITDIKKIAFSTHFTRFCHNHPGIINRLVGHKNYEETIVTNKEKRQRNRRYKQRFFIQGNQLGK